MPNEAVETVVRFTPWERFEHAAVMLLFIALVVTGLPQKWPDFELSRGLIDGLGGVYAMRYLHRIGGVIFALLLVAHMARVVSGVITRRYQPTMLITRKDFQDTVDSLRYYLGRADSPPRCGRFDYRQKFEYWGLIFGSLVMVASGFVLYFPIFWSRLLPAEIIPACKVMHSQEAMLALLIVIIWHMYDTHLNPEVFPFDSSIFTGKISKERLRSEHALEAEELEGKPE